jgi:zinc transport system substrate-binding protein
MRRLALALALTAAPAFAAGPLSVYAVNAPLAAFAERLGGDAVTVTFPVPEGRDAAFWRPPIAVIADFQAADLILLNGAGFAGWTAKASLPRARTVDTARGFADRFIETEGVVHSHGPEGAHSHAGVASFTWLDFAQAAAQADAVAAALARRLPGEAAAIDARRAALAAELLALDARARDVAAAAGGAPLIASHPRYQYFARAYGLRIESLEWDAGAAPTAEEWADFDALAARLDAPLAAMLWEAAPPAEAAAALAARGVPGAVLDTGAGGDWSDWIGRMRAGLDALALALGAG